MAWPLWTQIPSPGSGLRRRPIILLRGRRLHCDHLKSGSLTQKIHFSAVALLPFPVRLLPPALSELINSTLAPSHSTFHRAFVPLRVNNSGSLCVNTCMQVSQVLQQGKKGKKKSALTRWHRCLPSWMFMLLSRNFFVSGGGEESDWFDIFHHRSLHNVHRWSKPIKSALES